MSLQSTCQNNFSHLEFPRDVHTSPVRRLTASKLKAWRCPYDILGVPKFSSREALKRAYRAKLLEQHPDSGKGDISQLEEILWAYKFLADEAEKRRYDEYLRTYNQVETYQQQAYLSVQWALWLHDFLTKEARKKARARSLREPFGSRILKVVKNVVQTEGRRAP